MRRYLHFTAALLTMSAVFAQTDLERKKIVADYNFSKIDSLGRVLKVNADDKNNRIKTFIGSNPEVKFKFVKNNNLYQLVDVVDGVPIYITTDNAEAALATRTNKLHPGGELGLSLEGEDMTIGVWDGGWARKTHVEFLNDNSVTRVTTPDNSAVINLGDWHGTHVSGTLVAKGTDPDAKGMAPKASLVSYDWNNDAFEVLLQASNGLLISNHSYGVPVINESTGQPIPAWWMGCYNSDAQSWDELAFNNPYYLMVTSAGNSGNDTYSGGLAIGYDKLTGEKNSKNNLVIANANPFVSPINGNINLLPINPSSSQGPSDDGRIKPDIAGDGTSLYSTTNLSNTSYGSSTGTSMASPNVAGSLLLLQEHYNNLNEEFMRSSTLKGLVCHTAKDDYTTVGPDPKFGWGLLDAGKAAEVITQDAAGQAVILETVLSDSETYTYTFSASDTEKVKATLCWIDPAGIDRTGSLNNSAAALVNDLDLRITKDGEEYEPWKLQLSDVSAPAIKGDNLVDNVEVVEVDVLEAGTYTVTVTHKGSLQDGEQLFSLIVTGGDLTLSTKESTLNEVKVWPNPAKDVINLKLTSVESNAKVDLYDIHGRVVYQGALKSSSLLHSINVKEFSAGVYFLNVENGTQTFNKKIVIE